MTRERGEGGLFKMKGSRMWYGQWYAHGKQIRVSLKTDVKEVAKKELRRLMNESDRGFIPESEARKVRYGDLRAALLHNYVERGNRSLQTTADGDETIWGLKPLDQFFGYKDEKTPGLIVTHITIDKIREFAMKRMNKGLSNDTVNGSLRLLNRMFHLAKEDQKVQVMPVIRLLKNSAARKGFLTKQKFDSLVSFLPDNLKPLITFLYYCGVRLGEARQIEWTQVDLAGKLILLEEDQTKNDEARTIPLTEQLIQMLEAIKVKEGTVFDDTNLRKEWQKACVAAGLGTFTKVEGVPDKRYNGLIIHDLRRSAIKNMMKAGVNEKVAMKISGHKTRDVFDRYHIVDASDVLEAMQKVQNSENGGASNR
jgi:integrase